MVQINYQGVLGVLFWMYSNTCRITMFNKRLSAHNVLLSIIFGFIRFPSKVQEQLDFKTI